MDNLNHGLASNLQHNLQNYRKQEFILLFSLNWIKLWNTFILLLDREVKLEDIGYEFHPFLKYFCFMAILYGLLMLIPSCSLLSDDPTWILGIIGCICLLGISLYVLKKTHLFTRWNRGVALHVKLLAIIPLFFGIITAIALILFAPFMNFFNRIGEGILAGFIR